MNLNETLQHLKDLSERKNNQAIGLMSVSESLSEWNHGYSEGLEYAIEQIEHVMKGQVPQ
ncbi:hypothetical protein AB1K09_20380 [Solibacillus silvestris]